MVSGCIITGRFHDGEVDRECGCSAINPFDVICVDCERLMYGGVPLKKLPPKAKGRANTDEDGSGKIASANESTSSNARNVVFRYGGKQALNASRSLTEGERSGYVVDLWANSEAAHLG